ncbi:MULTISPECIES: septation protein SepH [Auritidibacter]|uniref:Septation protein SepH n=2 Tax=Micrococcaceae TaxID=1268 RepID=A0AAJ6AKJ0_9MICC|nr:MULTISPECIES: septation protein SepH [Auritidibacter]WGH93934.1 septation protein SepH [Auritidibacter ignavus]
MAEFSTELGLFWRQFMDSPQSPDHTTASGARRAQPLRLVGVDDAGDHLILSNDAGEEFSLPITDALRHATTRPIGRPSAAAADEAAAVTLSPRDIQSKIRAGYSVDELASRYDVSLDRLKIYEAPVLAERRWIVDQARAIEVSSPQLGHDIYRAVFGEEPALLEPMVRHRLAALGLDTSTLEWDAWKEEGSNHWTISASFQDNGAQTQIGDEPVARWSFRPAAKHVDNLNRWAQVLSELEPLDTPTATPTRRLSAVSSAERVFDVESTEKPDPRPRRHFDSDAQEELLEVLHARRGQRLGVDEDADDELAMMITREEHPTSWTGPRLVVSGESDSAKPAESETADQTDPDTEQPGQQEPEPSTRAGVEDESSQPEKSTSSLSSVSSSEYEGQTDAFDGMDEASRGNALHQQSTQHHQDGKDGRSGSSASKSTRKRPRVPSWDEIMFGTRKDD